MATNIRFWTPIPVNQQTYYKNGKRYLTDGCYVTEFTGSTPLAVEGLNLLAALTWFHYDDIYGDSAPECIGLGIGIGAFCLKPGSEVFSPWSSLGDLYIWPHGKFANHIGAPKEIVDKFRLVGSLYLSYLQELCSYMGRRHTYGHDMVGIVERGSYHERLEAVDYLVENGIPL